jgi:hypothetical protein
MSHLHRRRDPSATMASLRVPDQPNGARGKLLVRAPIAINAPFRVRWITAPQLAYPSALWTNMDNIGYVQPCLGASWASSVSAGPGLLPALITQRSRVQIPSPRRDKPQVIYEGRAGVKASPGHHLLAAGDDGPEAGVKVERPAGRTPLTPARTVVGWNEWWSWPCIKWGSLDQSSIRVGSHDGRAAWAAQSERAAVPKEAMTCGERAPTRFEALIGGPGRPGSRPRPGGRSSKA